MMRSSPISILSHLDHCEDLLQCVYNLTHFEVEVYRLLLMEGPLTAADVGKKMGRSSNSAYRFLRSLLACKLVYKKQKNRNEGGYQYLYYPEDPEEVRERLRNFKVKWNQKIDDLIAEFPRDVPKDAPGMTKAI